MEWIAENWQGILALAFWTALVYEHGKTIGHRKGWESRGKFHIEEE